MTIRSGGIVASVVYNMMAAMANIMVVVSTTMAVVAIGCVAIASVMAWVSYCYRYCCRHHGCHKYL